MCGPPQSQLASSYLRRGFFGEYLRANCQEIGKTLLKEGFARSWGLKRRSDWCDCANALHLRFRLDPRN
ncbi:hypothetical protein ELG74_30660 (plasmid) [Rhizobium leguminosarum]|nr:hypothetical protein ELG74_30660 [Rhizobium leguminosarum]